MTKLRALSVICVVICFAARGAAQSRSFTLPEGQEFTTGDRPAFSLSTDGTRIVYVARGLVFQRELNGQDAIVVRGPAEGRGKSNPIFSPDGRSIVYWAQDDSVLERVPVTGGKPTRIAPVSNPIGISWGSDGSLLVGQGMAGIVRIAANGGTPETVIATQPGETAILPHMLPDGDHVLFSLGEGTPTTWKVVAQSIRTRDRTVVVAGSNGHYLPGGGLVYLNGSTVMAVRFDAATLKVSGQPVPLAENVQLAAGTQVASFSVAPNGVLALSKPRVAPLRMALVGLDGTRTTLGEVLPGTEFPRVSSDGKRVTFHAATPGRGRDAYIAELTDIANPKRVIANASFPVFSPDGAWLVFGSLNTVRENGEEAMFIVPSNGQGEPKLIAKPARAPESWRAGPQGFSFITLRGSADNYDLWAYSVDKKEAEPLAVIAESAQLSGVFSPDLKWLTYMSNETGEWQIWVQPYPSNGARYQVTTAGGFTPMWLPDGRLVFDQGGSIATVTFRAGTPPTFSQPTQHPITGFVAQRIRRAWDVMPDGRLLMLFRDGPQIDVLPVTLDQARPRRTP